MGSREGLRSSLSLLVILDVDPSFHLPGPSSFLSQTLGWVRSPSPNPRSLTVLARCISRLHCLVPQGLESPPREEVFLGAFQFQPENIIQMFQLQVPGGASAECTPRATPPVPYSPKRCTDVMGLFEN